MYDAKTSPNTTCVKQTLQVSEHKKTNKKQAVKNRGL